LGTSIQSGAFTTGSNVQLLSNGLMKVQSNGISTSLNGLYSTTIATSSANSNSPKWAFNGGVWNAILGTPGFDGPSLQGVPISPTPAGHSGQAYLTLQPGTGVNEVGLDLRNTTLPNYLNTIIITGGTTGDPLTTDSGGKVVPITTGYTGSCASTTTLTVVNGLITGCS
jgi:hypothetical protein